MLKWINRFLLFCVYVLLIVAVGGILSYYLFKFPEPKHFSPFANTILVHRSRVDDYPDNSLEALNAACAKHIPAVEMDLLVSKDNKLVIFHDWNLQPDFGINNLVPNMTYDELNKVTLKQHYKVPLLTEVLSLVSQCHMKIQIDVRTSHKSSFIAKRITAIFKQHPNYHNMVLVSSFYLNLIYAVKKADPNIITSLAMREDVLKNSFLNYLYVTWLPEFLGVNVVEPKRDMVSPNFINKWKKHHVSAIVWTVNNKVTKNYITNILKSTYMTNCYGANITCPDRIGDQLKQKANY